MNATLYINGKKTKFSASLGWYKGEDFWLLKIGLFNKMQDVNSLCLIDLQFLKFLFQLGVDWGVAE